MKKYHVLSVILSLILCLSLCFSMLPYTALAEEGSGGETAGETMPLSAEEESGSRTTPGEIPENKETGSEFGEAGGESGEASGESGEAGGESGEASGEPGEAGGEPGEAGGEPGEAGGESGKAAGEEPENPDGEPGETSGGENPENQQNGAEQTAAFAEKIVLDLETASMDALDTLQLLAQVYPENCDQSVIWESSDPSVAVVDENGLVTAIGRGEIGTGIATITATTTARAEDDSVLSASCYVTVRSDGTRVDRVEELVSEHPYRDGESRFWEFSMNDAENLALTFAPETALGVGDFLLLQFGDNEQISYSADNIADLAGQTIAISGNGLRIWLISDDDGNVGWGFQVTDAAEAAEDDELAQSQNFADPLKNINSPRLMSEDLNGANPSAADGLLGAPGDSGSTSAPVASVTLSATELSMEALDKTVLTATIDPADNPNLSVKWSSSDKSVAVVVDGEVQAQTTHGVAIITATVLYDDGSEAEGIPATDADGQPAAASCTVTVTK